MPDTNSAKFNELCELIDGMEIAIMTTVGKHGELSSRPIQSRLCGDHGAFWFMTSHASHKVQQIHANPEVCLSFSSDDKNRYVCVYGTATELRDQDLIDQMWTLPDKIFFPLGQTDPDLTVLRVEPSRAECWTGPTSTVGKVIAFAKAAVSGDPHQLSEKIDLKFQAIRRAAHRAA